jgi:hypothetical protein
MRKWWMITMAIIVLACSNNRIPKGILSEKQITPVLVDLHLAEGVYNQRYVHPTTRENYPEDLYLSILKKYKLDRKVFEASVLFYGKHPDKYTIVYDEILNRLNEMSVKSRARDSIESRKPKVQPIVKDTAKIIKKDTTPAGIPMN